MTRLDESADASVLVRCHLQGRPNVYCVLECVGIPTGHAAILLATLQSSSCRMNTRMERRDAMAAATIRVTLGDLFVAVGTPEFFSGVHDTPPHIQPSRRLDPDTPMQFTKKLNLLSIGSLARSSICERKYPGKCHRSTQQFNSNG
jgi:hypothetical protein